MLDNEIDIVCKLTGASPDQIKSNDEGVHSRGYIVNNGAKDVGYY
jgi:hypothetical protein